LEINVSYQQRRKESAIKNELPPKSIDSTAMRKSFSPIRIALIDTSVNKRSFSRIKNGVSFLYHKNKGSPWWPAIDTHGTQMAELICQLDPFCELYIAKAGVNKLSHTRVAKVSLVIIEDYRFAKYS
jgi:hypothetical protein